MIGGSGGVEQGGGGQSIVSQENLNHKFDYRIFIFMNNLIDRLQSYINKCKI